MKRIYRMAKEVDDVVGEVVREVKKQGEYNNTLFVFTTDNGVFHGEHQLAGKWFPHEESVRVPLIIKDPRMSAGVRGTNNDDLTLNVDLAPTLLSAAGIKVPWRMQGRDIAQLYLPNPGGGGETTAAAKPWRSDFFYEWHQGDPHNAEGHGFADWIPPVFALIRKDYKYFYWPRSNYTQIFHVEGMPMHNALSPFSRCLAFFSRFAFKIFSIWRSFCPPLLLKTTRSKKRTSSIQP